MSQVTWHYIQNLILRTYIGAQIAYKNKNIPPQPPKELFETKLSDNNVHLTSTFSPLHKSELS